MDEIVGIKNKILLVDDTPENLALLIETLEPSGYQIFIADSGEKALEIAPKIEPDLILLDIMMPGIDGYETCKRLKENKKLKDIPVIFLSALDSAEDKIKAFEIGGVDYISKPFNHLEVLQRVRTHLRISNMLRSLGELIRKTFHEIYTPLSIIDTAVEMQRLEYGDTEYLDSISAASKSLHVIHEDVYYAMKREVMEYEPQWIDLEQFIEDRIRYFQVLASTKKMRFVKKFEAKGAKVFINEAELQRIVDNIFSNAIKYGKEGSDILVETFRNEKGVCFSVTDYGKVIKNRKKIFEKLYRESEEENGLGIGLDIVRVIVKKYGIDVQVESENEQTSFTFCFSKMSDESATS
jgi:DNA-binding response OmpR family regulator/anti-sigma regulatory factor (Ser/Thr protein kinase)